MPKYFVAYANICSERPEQQILGSTIIYLRGQIKNDTCLRDVESKLQADIVATHVTITNFINMDEENSGDQMF